MTDRTDRVLMLLTGNLSPEDALAQGVTVQDAADAVSVLRLDLELERAEPRESFRGLVDEFLRALDGG